MKIALCSDSHGNTTAVDEIYKRYPDCDFYLHAGDGETSSSDVFPFEMVKGNRDWDDNLPEKLLFHTPYGSLLMQHSPRISLNFLREQGIKIFVHGHTHTREHFERDGVIWLNPGAISFARDGNDLSFAIIDISQDGLKVNFFSLLDKKTNF
ncbi:MAG: YfcE family phosphodiesterase [Erysipelotrichaceae bacterium]|jgi:putative phosphoesterase|nr:metallophosphoesterase family protein [Bacilli bacterium]NLV28610.1 YfcE family phosphodiesterase [Erysipelotrichaceae bacterium]HPY79489.1 metallophosphoesterase family protein [Bacilli bacterium]HQA55557.1 metallophosphoesterase family protein [Bacilli bacterium]